VYVALLRAGGALLCVEVWVGFRLHKSERQ
jgi:hypothetical protein